MYWSRNSRNVLFLILLAVLFLPASLSAQEQSAGIWKVDSAATLEIDAHDTCKEITNNHASGQPMMVPTGSSAQWSTFLSNLPAGVTADDCSGGCIYTALTIGESCDGVIYAGLSGGNRIYTTVADQGWFQWKTENTTTAAYSTTNGVANTNAMETAGLSLHPAAQACRALGTEWYLPSQTELDLLYDNLVDQNGDNTPGGPLGSTFGFGASQYWSSTDDSFSGAGTQRFSDGVWSYGWRLAGYSVRCITQNLENTGLVALTYSGATHSETDCADDGGEVVSTPGGTLCRFTRTSCVSGWAKADNWSTTTTKTASCNSVAVPAEAFTCKGETLNWPSIPSFSTTIYAYGHAWSNNAAARTRYLRISSDHNPAYHRFEGGSDSCTCTNSPCLRTTSTQYKIQNAGGGIYNGICNTGQYKTALWRVFQYPTFPGASQIMVEGYESWGSSVTATISQIGCK